VKTYLIETVVRTVKLGHPLTQGTVDIQRALGLTQPFVTPTARVWDAAADKAPCGEVDPWSHFINVYMLDKEGNRVDRLKSAGHLCAPL
jgi:hypothetical protein